MPQNIYCWRCDMILPMLDEEEWAQLEPLLANPIQRIKSYREAHGVDLREAHEHAFDEALAFYNALTGFNETNANAVWHHRIADYGPPCTHCGKPLRTPRAKLCAACGRDRDPPLPP
jgi:hypothetical protein